MGSHDDDDDERVILVVGACTLDRILSVPSYPPPDAKIRSTSSHECGGGNAANVAAASSLASDASVFVVGDDDDDDDATIRKRKQRSRRSRRIRTRLLTKIGSDRVGDGIVDELIESGVDVSSSLFVRGPEGSSTSVTTVIVDEEHDTRTCIHTPGTCGELNPSDVSSSASSLDEVFRNVAHFHTDSRHSAAAVVLAREARRRGIVVSIDLEKDRRTKEMDEMVDLADWVFTNEASLARYAKRRGDEFEAAAASAAASAALHGEGSIRRPFLVDDDREGGRSRLLPSKKDPIIVDERSSDVDGIDAGEVAAAVRAVDLCHFFVRWYSSREASRKEIVITRGSSGSIHVRCHPKSLTQQKAPTDVDVRGSARHEMAILPFGADAGTLRIRQSISGPPSYPIDGAEETNGPSRLIAEENEYVIHRAGTLRDAKVVDTTGAGDAFIGGYVLASVVSSSGRQVVEQSVPPKGEVSREERNEEEDRLRKGGVCFRLNLGSWVAGKKIGGPGARTSLPRGSDVDEELGTNLEGLERNLRAAISRRPP